MSSSVDIRENYQISKLFSSIKSTGVVPRTGFSYPGLHPSLLPRHNTQFERQLMSNPEAIHRFMTQHQNPVMAPPPPSNRERFFNPGNYFKTICNFTF
jgi:hypothetical protein